MRIAVFASGNGSNFEAIATESYNKIEIAVLITDNPNAYCITRSKNLNIPFHVFPFRNYNDKQEYETSILKKLQEYQIDIIILAGYMRIIGDVLLNNYPNKIINIHPSLLPAFKGKYGIKDAYDYGVKIMGVTIHYVTKELDGGKIIAQECIKVDNKSLEKIESEIHKLEHKLYPQVIKNLFDELEII